MRSKTTQKIIDSTPDEIRKSVREYANEMANSAHSYTEGAEKNEQNESLKQSLREIKECALGVGDGSGQHFVHGDYESVKLLQTKILRWEQIEQSLRELIDVAEKDLLRYARNFHNDYSTTVSAVVIKRAKAAIDRAKSKL